MPVSGRTSKTFLKNGLIAFTCVPGAVLLLGFLSLRPFTAPSYSMAPNLLVGDYFFADRFRTPFHEALASGDVVTFDHRGVSYVKRIVGMPGEMVQMKDGRLVLDGEPVQLEAVGKQMNVMDRKAEIQLETLPSGKSYRVLDTIEGLADNTRQWQIPEGHYFLLGDNRDNSADSRFHIGLVPNAKIHGRVRFVLFNTHGKSIFGRAF